MMIMKHFSLRRYVLLFLLSLMVVGVQASDKPWVLLEEDQAAILIHQCSRESPAAIRSVWTPTAAVLQKMESRLVKITQLESKACCGAGSKVGDVADYYRQYAGLVIEDQKFIYINAFSRQAGVKDWRDLAVLACDGGRSFWGVLYDPISGDFFDLAFNGEA